jgi:hypothetical protein
MNEIWIVNDFSGVQRGTKDNPCVAKTAAEYDALIASLLWDENGKWRKELVIHMGDGEFLTQGCYEWGPYATKDRPRFGPKWQMIGTGNTVISLDYQSLPDAQIDGWPMHVFCSTSQWMEYLWYGREAEWDALTPEQVWAGVPEGQLLRDLTIKLNYSKFIDRWRGHDAKLCLSAAILQGHGAAYENVNVIDFGAHKPIGPDGKPYGPSAESFPLIIAGAVDGFDRNKLAKLDNTQYVYDSHLPDDKCAHATGCKVSGYADADSNDQVSCIVFSGGIGQPSLPSNSAGDETAPFKHTLRKFAYAQNNVIDLPNANALNNQVQGFTIYQSQRGDISHNRTNNCNAGYYSDFYKSNAVDVHDNEFLRCLRGAAFLLSPVGPDFEHFTSENHKVRRNKITQIPINVENNWNAGVLLWKFPVGWPDTTQKQPVDESGNQTRYMRNFVIGGPGEENDISVDGKAGIGNYAIIADGIDGIDASVNRISSGYSHPIDVIRCTGVKVPPTLSWWQRLLKFLHLSK